ncbi:Lysosomal cystine transporter [Parasponia andersonii]|uniref:Lysosomal cystine transporter n=1 Tax=Parasponia andersonii TaxID=3476 RepID=A0A2P5B5I0_PARAD|nr:Lysosomal cystine transporter [Parasponia andersonii]
MAPWNSIPLEITCQVLGWIAFLSWTISSYPQIILNFRRRSVVGLNFDFVVLNITKRSSYLIYNATLYFCSAVQKQYYEKYGFDQGGWAVVEGGNVQRRDQTVSKTSLAIVAVVWSIAGICFFIALPTHSWLWLIDAFK